ncbi:MAG: segregation/condensation protein A [Planctomycetales bacterium]|nr:segregation/condensation protein A [Planctomycetales bacterium]
MSEYRVNLDGFAGPLDLLLYLVRKEEVDIYDIPIARVTQQYIQYIEILKSLDIDLAGDFLVMAATLMEIKSAMLLPKTDLTEQDEAAGDPRSELVRQLLEYKKYKDAANLLQEAGDERQLRFTRSNSILEKIKPTQEPELDLDQVSIWTLLEAFDAILKATGNINTAYDHIKDDTPIDLYQIELLHRLQTEGPMTLQKVFEGKTHRLVMIGLFLAMLELMRNHLVWVEQPEAAGAIYLKSMTSEPAEQAVQNAIYANPEALERASEQPVLSEPAHAAEEPSGLPDSGDAGGEDAEDEFYRELSSIRIPSEQADTPRIPIKVLPPESVPDALPQPMDADEQDSEEK